MKRNGIFLIVLGIAAFAFLVFLRASDADASAEDVATITTILGGAGGVAIVVGAILLMLGRRPR